MTPHRDDGGVQPDRSKRAVRHLTSEDVVLQPWKNGRGVTRELAIWPPGSTLAHGDFEWRISCSVIESPGPFSKFAGFDRVLVITRGTGLSLAHGEDAPRARLRTFEPYRFSGEWTTRCDLVAGAVEDLNVISRASQCRVHVEVSRLGDRRTRETIGPGHAFAHVLSGRVIARVMGEEEPFELEAGESLWAQSLGKEEEIEVAGMSSDTVVVLIGIAAVDGGEG